MDIEQHKRNWLPALAITDVTLFTFLLYDSWLIDLSWMNPVFRNPYFFVGSYVLCLGLVVTAFLRGRPSTLAKLWMLAGTVIVLAFPLLAPRLYDQHQLYVKSAPGYELQRVTQPGSRTGSALKTAQREHETGWCKYTLYGWGDENQLYYRSSCRLGYRRYDPTTGKTRWLMSIPIAVRDNAPPYRRRMFGSPSSWSPSLGLLLSTQYPFPVEMYYIVTSPDGQWQALALREFYGPHDVVVLQSAG